MPDSQHVSDTNRQNSNKFAILLEKSWELSWVLRVLCAGVFLDSFMILSASIGIYDWAFGTIPPLNLGWVILTGLSFCVTVGLVLPFVLWLLRLITIAIPSIGRSEQFNWSDSNYIYEGRVLDDALKRESQFSLDWYQNRQQKNLNQARDRDELSDLLASLILLGAVNYFSGHYVPNANSLVLTVWGLPSDVGRFLLGGFAFSSILLIVQTWREPSFHRIYYPELAARERENRRK